jgi:hypothetical protein
MTMTPEEIIERIKELETEKTALENNENKEEYDEMLDCEGPVKVCGMDFYPSRILEELDPVTYSCGMNDYNDARLSEIETEIDDLKQELQDLADEVTE